MKFWYFNYEGVFEQGATEHGNGVFSSVLVPESDFQKARSKFRRRLAEDQIELVETIEYFSVDAEELDASDPDNEFWIDWHDRALKSGEIESDIWHLYKLGT